MFIGTDAIIPWESWIILLKNEVEFGRMRVTWRQYFSLDLMSDYSYHFEDFWGISPLRDGVDWLVSKLCPGEVYYHSISNITVFRLV